MPNSNENQVDKSALFFVILGLDPRICWNKRVDPRVKPEDDGVILKFPKFPVDIQLISAIFRPLLLKTLGF